MRYQTTKMLVDMIFNVIDRAPNNQNSPYQGTINYQHNNLSNAFVDKQVYNIWVDYVKSILEIISNYVDVSKYVDNINRLGIDGNNNYVSKINEICNMLLNLAEMIVHM